MNPATRRSGLRMLQFPDGVTHKNAPAYACLRRHYTAETDLSRFVRKSNGAFSVDKAALSKFLGCEIPDLAPENEVDAAITDLVSIAELIHEVDLHRTSMLLAAGIHNAMPLMNSELRGYFTELLEATHA